MSIEVGEPEEYVVKRYTEFFVKSKDLTNWEMLPYDTCYTRSRYNACQVIRFHNGYLLYDLPRGAPARAVCPYIYRTRDFEVWEIGLHIPIMHVSKEDRMPRTGYAFTPEEEKKRSYLNINNCDIDLCEFRGENVYINYLTGDQLGFYCMCEA
jgi:hypothetical protein